MNAGDIILDFMMNKVSLDKPITNVYCQYCSFYLFSSIYAWIVIITNGKLLSRFVVQLYDIIYIYTYVYERFDYCEGDENVLSFISAYLSYGKLW